MILTALPVVSVASAQLCVIEMRACVAFSKHFNNFEFNQFLA